MGKDSGTHMHGLTVYVKEGLFFARDISLENSADSYLQYLTSFFLNWSPSLSLCMVFDSISSNVDEVLLINPSANLFVFGDFNVHQKTGLSILVEQIDLVNSVIIFPFQMTLLRRLTFLLRFQTVILSHALMDFFPLMLVFVLQWLAHFIALLMTILMLIGMVFMIIWEMFHGRISLVLLLLLVNFVSGFRLELMYIFLIESIRSSLTNLQNFQLLVLLW